MFPAAPLPQRNSFTTSLFFLISLCPTDLPSYASSRHQCVYTYVMITFFEISVALTVLLFIVRATSDYSTILICLLPPGLANQGREPVWQRHHVQAGARLPVWPDRKSVV